MSERRLAGGGAGRGHLVNPMAKLDWAKVDSMRAWHRNGKTIRECADMFGVGYITARDVLRHESWKR